MTVRAGAILLLFAISSACDRFARGIHSPVPGFVFGFAIVYAGLATGLLQLSWIRPTARLLSKHMTLFLVPIAAAVLDHAGLLAAHGVAIVLVLVISLAAGLLVTGHAAQTALRAEGGGSEHVAT